MKVYCRGIPVCHFTRTTDHLRRLHMRPHTRPWAAGVKCLTFEKAGQTGGQRSSLSHSLLLVTHHTWAATQPGRLSEQSSTWRMPRPSCLPLLCLNVVGLERQLVPQWWGLICHGIRLSRLNPKIQSRLRQPLRARSKKWCAHLAPMDCQICLARCRACMRQLQGQARARRISRCQHQILSETQR